MTRKDLYYNEYTSQFELSKEELNEYTKTIYNQAVNDFVLKMKKYWGGLSAMNEIERVAEQLKQHKRK